MSRHVVRTFNGVGVQRIVLPHEPIQPRFQITLHVGIGILLNHETGRSVLDEQRAQTLLRSGFMNHPLNFWGELMQTLTCGLDRDCFDHRIYGT